LFPVNPQSPSSFIPPLNGDGDFFVRCRRLKNRGYVVSRGFTAFSPGGSHSPKVNHSAALEEISARVAKRG
jgi:hypothetical protein